MVKKHEIDYLNYEIEHIAFHLTCKLNSTDKTIGFYSKKEFSFFPPFVKPSPKVIEVVNGNSQSFLPILPSLTLSLSLFFPNFFFFIIKLKIKRKRQRIGG